MRGGRGPNRVRPDLQNDSVLRGPIAAELDVVLDLAGPDVRGLRPAKPWSWCVIVDGVYTIDDVPLNATPFGADPEHPARSADVLDLLGSHGTRPTACAAPGDASAPGGITIGSGNWRRVPAACGVTPAPMLPSSPPAGGILPGDARMAGLASHDTQSNACARAPRSSSTACVHLQCRPARPLRGASRCRSRRCPTTSFAAPPLSRRHCRNGRPSSASARPRRHAAS